MRSNLNDATLGTVKQKSRNKEAAITANSIAADSRVYQ